MRLTKPWGLRIICIISAMTFVRPCVLAQEDASPVDAHIGEADKAWEEVKLAKRAYATLIDEFQQGSSASPRPPANARAFMDQVKTLTGAIGDKAGVFIEKFPRDERASEAREVAMKMWGYLAMMGDNERARRYGKLLDACLADVSLPEDERAQLYLRKLELKSPASDATAALGNLRALNKEFPNSRLYYHQLLNVARRAPGDEGRKIAAEVVAAPAAPAELRNVAQDIVDGKPPYEVGKPVEIRFTALDGREVDVAKMKGKVVLVDFWATWCGPCVKELPNLKALYDKYHAEGLEVIGISYDSVQSQLLRFIKEKDIRWPQYFEPWANTMGVRYPVNGIPTVWLIGRDGNLAFTNAREGLEEKLVKLLEANAQAAQQ